MPEVRVARVELPDTPEGAAMPDASRVAEYLSAGTAILFTTATAPDHFDPDAGEPAGLSVRSDGVWVWSDVITYYTRRYGIPPEPDLLAHIRQAGYVCPQLSDGQAAETLDAFYAAREA
jgi:hypothetical protein